MKAETNPPEMGSNQQDKQIFCEAQEHPPDQREAFLRRACQGDEAQLRRVQSLLAAYEDAEGVLNPEILDGKPLNDDGELAEAPGAVIGHYKLLELIGEGGFGRVYVAEQEEPVRRRVALKIIKLGMDTRQVVARFEAERQALAMMDHPHIAKVLDAGATETGRPYFVMELVRGIAITEFCDKNHLSVRQRLELFIPVCQAIQHAHQKGVIHRDLKPSNILVALDDGVAHPMVIDFGVAKAINHRLTEKTLYTNFSQMIGTPAYMSPEQAEMSKQDVDTRTDVYALGILLYELLTGTTPFPEERLREAGYAEIQRIIREEEPERPSTRMSTMQGEALAVLAKNRESQPESLRRFVRGDLDWIVMKTLEKDRRRRYGAASELVADLERHLHHEPVLASPPSLQYQIGKFVRRHQTGVAAGMAIVMTLVLGAGVSAWMAVRATRAERQAVSEAAVSKAVNEFLLNDLLGQGNPWEADPTLHVGKDTTLRAIIDRAAAHIDGEFPDQPEVEAAIRLNIGLTYDRLQDVAAAEPHIRRAYAIYRGCFGPEDPRTLSAHEAMGWLFRSLGKSAEAAQTFREVLELRRKTQGPESYETCQTMLALGFVCKPRSQAKHLFEDVVRLASGIPEQERYLTAVATEGLAYIARVEDDLTTSQRLYRQAYEAYLRLFGRDHSHTLRMRYQVAYHLWKVDGNLMEAEQELREVMETGLSTWGTGTYLSLTPMLDLARLLDDKGEHLEAQRLLAQMVENSERAFGPDHPDVLVWRQRAGDQHARMRRWESAANAFLPLAQADPSDGESAIKASQSAWLSGNSGRAREILARTLVELESEPEDDIRLSVAETVCLLFREQAEFQPHARLLETRVSPEDLSRAELIRGIAALRLGKSSGALGRLTPLRTNSQPYVATQPLAGFFSAIALHRSGRVETARQVLQEARETCEANSVNGRWADDWWVGYASCLIARIEAEGIIVGGPTSQPAEDEASAGQATLGPGVPETEPEPPSATADNGPTEPNNHPLEVPSAPRKNTRSPENQ